MNALAKYYLVAQPCTMFSYADMGAYGKPWESWFKAIETDIGDPVGELFSKVPVTPNPEFLSRPNLIENAGFEQSSGWTFYSWSPENPAQCSFDASTYYEGTRSLKVGDSDGKSVGGAFQYLNLKPNSTYTYGAWYKTDSEGFRAVGYLGKNAEGELVSADGKIYPSPSGGWTYLTFLLNTSADPSGAYIYPLQSNNRLSGSYAFADDARLVEGNYARDEIVARRYQRALVLLRVPNTLDEDLLANPVELPLDAWYRELASDGTLSAPVRKISLLPYEGKVLIEHTAITSVGIKTIPASPSVTPGTRISFDASATCGSAGSCTGRPEYSPQYYFTWRNPTTGKWTAAQPYGSARTWTWDTTGLLPGAYTVQVWARNAGSTAAYEAFVSRTITLLPPVSAVNVVQTPASPSASSGQKITFSANAACGSSTCPSGVEYYFTWRNPITSVWTAAQPYSTANTWTWDTTGLSPGDYTVQTWARSAGSTAAYEAYDSRTIRLLSPVTSVNIGTNLFWGFAYAGTSVVISGNAMCGLTACSNGAEYSFYWRHPVTGLWTAAQAYSTANAWTWNTAGLPSGWYYVQVWARSIGSSAEYDSFGTLTFYLF